MIFSKIVENETDAVGWLLARGNRYSRADIDRAVLGARLHITRNICALITTLFDRKLKLTSMTRHRQRAPEICRSYCATSLLASRGR